MSDNATISGIPFRLNPKSVQGSFAIKTNSTDTKGGRVVQVIGTDWGVVSVDGTFGVGGWQEQRVFFDNLQNKLQDISKHPAKPPLRFSYPTYNWDFQVYITAYSSLEGDAISHSNNNIAPTWRLSMIIVDDGGLKKAAINQYIERLSEGIGWKRTVFNGPLDGGYQTPEQKIIDEIKLNNNPSGRGRSRAR